MCVCVLRKQNAQLIKYNSPPFNNTSQQTENKQATTAAAQKQKHWVVHGILLMLSNNHYHLHFHHQHHCSATHAHNAISIYILVCWFLFWYLHCSFPNSQSKLKSGAFSLAESHSISPILWHRQHLWLFDTKKRTRRVGIFANSLQFSFSFFSIGVFTHRNVLVMSLVFCFAICILQIFHK